MSPSNQVPDRPDSPYASPQAPPDPSPPSAAKPHLALLLAFAPVFGLALAIFSLALGTALIAPVIMAVGTVLAVAGLVFGVRGAVAGAGFAASIAAVFISLFTAPLGALMTLAALGGFSRGRQLRRWGKPVFAPLVPEASGWLPSSETLHLDTSAPLEAAEAWRHNGLTEHASVAAFGRVAAELVSLGAPANLIEAAYADALDEHRHTRLCFGLARDLDGRTLAPGPLPAVSALGMRGAPRAARLAHLAVESLVDGALNEGVSARVVAGLSRVAELPRIREVLSEIARDEARHAAHGFQVLRWCLEEGGAPVAVALEAALKTLPIDAGALPYDVEEAETWGLPSRARLRAEYRSVRERTVARTRRLLRSAGRRRSSVEARRVHAGELWREVGLG